MTDKEIIENHLNKYYNVQVSANRDDVFDYLIGARYGSDGKHLSEKYLVNEVTEIFGNYITDGDMTIGEIVRDWLGDRVRGSFEDLRESLKEVEVIFGSRSWEVKKNGKKFYLDDLIEEYEGKYHKSTVVAIYEQWKHEQIIEISDRILSS